MTITDADEKPEPVVEWKDVGGENNEDLRVGEDGGKVTWKPVLAVVVGSKVCV